MDEEEKSNKKWDSDPKIIIIGSGISGIAAGEYLSRKGFKNFKILEASSRTGGRIWSVNVGKWLRVKSLRKSSHGITA